MTYKGFFYGLFLCMLHALNLIPLTAQAQGKDRESDVLLRVRLMPGPRGNGQVDTLRLNFTGFQSVISSPVKQKEVSIAVPRKMLGRTFRVTYDLQISAPNAQKYHGPKWFLGSFVLEDSLFITVYPESGTVKLLNGKQNEAKQFSERQLDTLEEELAKVKDSVAKKAVGAAVYQKAKQLLPAKRSALKQRFMQDHPNTFQAMMNFRELFLAYLREDMSLDTTGTVFQQYMDQYLAFENEVRATGMGKDMLSLLENTRYKSVPHFSGEMPDGRLFHLDSLKGKVILVDFWASWCVPCRAAHPHLKQLYEKYHHLGLEVVGIGIERGTDKSESWGRFKKAIAEDEVPWIQVLEDKDQHALADEFGVMLLPTKFLIDRDGKLVMRMGVDPERLLDKKLDELFTKK